MFLDNLFFCVDMESSTAQAGEDYGLVMVIMVMKRIFEGYRYWQIYVLVR